MMHWQAEVCSLNKHVQEFSMAQSVGAVYYRAHGSLLKSRSSEKIKKYPVIVYALNSIAYALNKIPVVRFKKTKRSRTQVYDLINCDEPVFGRFLFFN